MRKKMTMKMVVAVGMSICLGSAFATPRDLYRMPVEKKLNDAAQWKADPGCKVERSPAIVAGNISTIELEVPIDKAKAGSSGMTIKNLNIQNATGFSFNVFNKRVGYIDVFVADKDGTAAQFYIMGLPSSEWKEYEVKLAEPAVIFRKGANGKLDGIDSVTFAITHQAGETMQDQFESLFFGQLKVAWTDAAIEKNRLVMKTQYDSLVTQAKPLVKQLTKELAGTNADDYRFAVANAALAIARDTLGWSKLDADWGVKNHDRVLQDAIDQAAWIISTCPKITQEVKTLKSQATDGKIQLRPVMQNLKVKNGNYYVGDKPVIITGMLNPWSYSGLRAQGFNGVALEQGIHKGFKKNMETRDQAAKDALGFLENCRKNNLAGDILATIHYLQDYMYKAKPDIDPSGFWKGHPFMPFNIESKGFRELVKTFLDQFVSAIGDNPSLASLDLINELWRRDYSDYKPEDYHAFLKKQHGDIARLNKCWGSDFKSFADVEHDPSSYGARYDMGLFTTDRVVRFLAWEKSVIRKHDKETPCYVKIHGGWIEVVGGNKESLNDVLDASGLDSYPETGDWKRSLAPGANRAINPEMLSDFWTQTMTIDYYNSIAPDKLVIDSENHIMPYTYKKVLGNHVYGMVWQGALHGRDATYLWIGSRRGIHPWVKMANDDFLLLAQPWVLHAASKAGIEQERLAENVVAFQNAPSEVALLFSGPELTKTYKAMFFQDVNVKFITDRMLKEGKLDKCKLLVIPGNAIVSEDALAKIGTFLKKGGKVFWSNNALERDHYGLAIPSEKLLKKYARSIKRPEGASLVKTLDKTLDWAGVERPIRSSGKYVELRTVTMNNGNKLLYMINFSKSTETVELKYSGKTVKTALDLITNQTVKLGNSITLEPGMVRLLHIGNDKN
ncbi:MAG: hypothetical protein DRQ57_16800 [Gammaproteobacteria bacterium]|nr:MAG: hypothetical protein DRQ57_16800 [Gammaproteobacteria bacterium]